MFRLWASLLVARLLVGAYVRVRIEGPGRLPPGPAILCFTHANWADPWFLLVALPARPDTYIFGPRDADMRRGWHNLLIRSSGRAVSFKPGNRDVLDTTRRVEAIIAAGGRLAIAGEGGIHTRESEVLPLSAGPAYFALRTGVPLVPVAISGTTWHDFGRRVRVRIGEPIPVPGRLTRAAVDELTEECARRLRALVAGTPEVPAPGPFGRWLTEAFNNWPGGRRPDDGVPPSHSS
ncbi:MAG TPA: lysophospholipid acyltransferase family protein [Patescibacteria group bacterium]|nr:lysophospholipid acyltransferase family protein [Patescibacteria group bacterium]